VAPPRSDYWLASGQIKHLCNGPQNSAFVGVSHQQKSGRWKNLGIGLYWCLIRNPISDLEYPDYLVPDFLNDHLFKRFIPHRGIISIVLTNRTIIGSSGAICFISQFKWQIPIPISTPILFLRQMETNALFKPVYLFEPIT
jgi:hypothetical protein